jgi:hypothetical protein
MAMWLGLAGLAVACRSSRQVPESGAVLLRLSVAAGSPTPDELRVWVYDDSGALWDGVRVPESGALVPESGARLGTILIQPGASVGALRLHVQALAGGARVLDGILTVAPEARDRGSFDLVLDPALLPDDDGDGVPDAIDDCPATANPAQGGCPDAGAPTVDAGPDTAGDAGRDADDRGGSVDSGDAAEAGCDAAGGCLKPQGATCALGAECGSGFCADGVCCASDCLGPCRSCNQPSSGGVCQAYVLGTDPERECASGDTCNGAGACGPAPPPGSKANGVLCGAAVECSSGFCKDGVCCNSACTATCQSCGSGTCQAVKRTQDVPECGGTMTCNANAKCVAS